MQFAHAQPLVEPPQDAVPIPRPATRISLRGWDHIVFSTTDLVEAERWYCEVLGAVIEARYGWAGDKDHKLPPHMDLLLGEDRVSLFLMDPTGRWTTKHLGCRDVAELDDWREHLAGYQVPVSPVVGHHGSSLVSIYFADPWGQPFAFTADVGSWETAQRLVRERNGRFIGRDFDLADESPLLADGRRTPTLPEIGVPTPTAVGSQPS